MKQIHWRIPFKNDDEVAMCINIYADGTPVEVKTLIGGAIWNGGIMETNEAYSDNKFDTLRFQTGTIHVANDDGDLLLYDIMPIKATDRPVQLVRESDGAVLWQGFLSCEGYTQQYVSRSQVVDFNIKSILKALEDQPIPDNFSEVHGDIALCVGDMIRTAIEEELHRNDCPFSITAWHYPDEYRFFQDCYVEMGLFYEDRDDIAEDGSAVTRLGGKTYGKMIETVCQYGCVAVRECGTEVYMQPISKNGAMDGVAQIVRPMTTLEARGMDQTIKTDYLYKSLMLTINPKGGGKGETALPNDSEISFGVNGSFNAPDQFSWVVMAWDKLEDEFIAINPDILRCLGSDTTIPLTDITPGEVANDYAKCWGGHYYIEGPGNVSYAMARLCKYGLKPYWGGDYNKIYGLAIIPHYLPYGSDPFGPNITVYNDTLVKIFQKEFSFYDNVIIKNLVQDKWSMINIQGTIGYFYGGGSGGEIKMFGDDDHWMLRCYFYIEDQFGVREYLVGASNNNPVWTTNKGIFSLCMQGNKVENNYDQSLYMINKVDGYVVKFDNPFGRRHIKCTMEIVVSAAIPNDPGGWYERTYCSLLLTEMKISAVEDPFKVGDETKLGRKMYKELGGVEDDKNVELNVCTSYRGSNNKHLSLLYKRVTDEEGTTAIVPAESIDYTLQDGTVVEARPERVLFDRMVEQWSKPRRQLDLTVKTIDDPLPMMQFTGYDGKKYLPLCEKRDWGSCTSVITFFEVE